MSTGKHYTVTVFLDADAGEAIVAAASKGPVWAVDSPANRAAAERHGRSYPLTQTAAEDLEHGITVFDARAIDDDLVPTVFEHHDEWAHDPPVTHIEVRGVEIPPSIERALRELGCDRIVKQAGLVQAWRTEPV